VIAKLSGDSLGAGMQTHTKEATGAAGTATEVVGGMTAAMTGARHAATIAGAVAMVEGMIGPHTLRGDMAAVALAAGMSEDMKGATQSMSGQPTRLPAAAMGDSFLHAKILPARPLINRHACFHQCYIRY